LSIAFWNSAAYNAIVMNDVTEHDATTTSAGILAERLRAAGFSKQDDFLTHAMPNFRPLSTHDEPAPNIELPPGCVIYWGPLKPARAMKSVKCRAPRVRSFGRTHGRSQRRSASRRSASRSSSADSDGSAPPSADPDQPPASLTLISHSELMYALRRAGRLCQLCEVNS
jgi:hypothetical protein